MARGHDDQASGLSRRGALASLGWGAGMLAATSALPERWSPFGAARASQGPTVPVIVQDPTRPYWRAVLAGARKAVSTRSGTIHSDHVVLACGGYVDRLFWPLSAATIPIATFVMTTEPLGDRLLGLVETRQERAGGVADLVGNHPAIGLFEFEGSEDQLSWRFEQFFGELDQLLRW